MYSNDKYSEKQIGIYTVINILLLALIVYASLSLTLGFFGSIGTGQVRQSNFIIGIVNDSCKIFISLVVGIAYEYKKYFLTAFLIGIVICTMCISYLASQGLDLNVSNEQLLDSSTKQELVVTKKEKVAELKKLQDEKAGLIAGFQAEIKKLPVNYPSTKKGYKQNITDTTERYSKLTQPVQAQIDTYSAKIENYKVDTSHTTEGYHALALYTGMVVGDITKYKNIFMELLSFALSLNLGMLLAGKPSGKLPNSLVDKTMGKLKGLKQKFTGKKNPSVGGDNPSEDIITAKCDNYGNPINTTNSDNSLEVGSHTFEPHSGEDTNNTVSIKKVIKGFVYEKSDITPNDNNTSFSNTDLAVYIAKMHETKILRKRGYESRGYQWLSTETGIDEEVCRKIKGHLENTGIIKCEGLKTFIL